jgi:hypothetical protein
MVRKQTDAAATRKEPAQKREKSTAQPKSNGACKKATEVLATRDTFSGVQGELMGVLPGSRSEAMINVINASTTGAQLK